MFCQKCGAEMPDGSKVCPKCGEAQGQASQPEKVGKPKKKKIGLWVALGIVIVIIISAVIGGGKEPTSQALAETSNTAETDSVSADPKQTANTDAKDVSDELTKGQKNALKKAKAYLSTAAFSHDGLVKQLEYEGYSNEDATYGADNCGADWNEQAEKKAKSYLDMMAFSRDGLIKQLEYEGFTEEQAVHGAEANGY